MLERSNVNPDPGQLQVSNDRPVTKSDIVELGGFAPVPVPVSSPDLFPKTLTLRTYTLLHD